MARRKLVAGNWKMNGTRVSAQSLVDAVDAAQRAGETGEVDIAVFPPFVYLGELTARYAKSRIAFGAQDVSEHTQGAFTGEVAAAMVRDVGATHVLVGHSERRQYHAESNECVARKFAQALTAELVPVLCVGETLEQREAGKTESVVAAQLACAGSGRARLHPWQIGKKRCYNRRLDPYFVWRERQTRQCGRAVRAGGHRRRLDRRRLAGGLGISRNLRGRAVIARQEASPANQAR